MAFHPSAGKALAKLRRWAERPDWAELLAEITASHLRPVAEVLRVTTEDLLGRLDDHSRAMVIGGIFEDFLTATFEGRGNIIDEYLARRGWNEPASAKRWLAALRRSRLSLWEVVALDPGRSFTLKDLVGGGEPVVVDERAGSRSAIVWDRLMVRIVTVDAVHHLSGVALKFGQAAAERVLERGAAAAKHVRRNTRNDEAAARISIAADLSPVLIQEWLIAFYSASTRRPQLLNADGEAFMFAKARFSIVGKAADAARRLDGVPDLQRPQARARRWDWFEAEAKKPLRARAAAADSRDAVRLISEDSRGRKLLGMVRLNRQELVLETNSRERLERGGSLMHEALGPLLGEASVELKSAEEMLSEERERKPPPKSGVSSEEEARIIGAYLDRHYRGCLDEPLTMLDGKTPRQAARVKKSRADVAEWLKLLENGDARRAAQGGPPAYNFSWMWEELGIAELRR
jgi:hypothetical protein